MVSQQAGDPGPSNQKARDLHTYLLSPIETLLESLEDESAERISSYDIIQAYGLCSARVKKVSALVRDGDERAIAVRYLKDNASAVSLCLSRDIGRALIDLCPELNDSDVVEDASKVSMSEEELQQARDNAALAQHALVLVGEISCVPELAHVFNDEDTAIILNSILSILNTPIVPTPGERKTRSLAMWALSLYHISPTIFQLEGTNVVQTLASNMSDKPEEEIIGGDALKALYHHLVAHPLSCLPLSLDLMEPVLRHLTSPSAFLRARAAQALVGFTRALLAHESPISDSGLPVRDIVSTRAAEYAYAQMSLDRKAQKDKRDAHPSPQTLSSLIYAEIPRDGKTEFGPRVGWAFSVLGSLVVLSDGRIFMTGSFLRFTLQTIAPCLVNSWRPLHQLHATIWRTLVWSSTRVAHIGEGTGEGASRTDDLREPVFRTVKQELPKYNVGASLVYALLGPSIDSPPDEHSVRRNMPARDDKDVARALTVMKDLANGGQHDEATALLSMCTRDISALSLERWDPLQILSKTLLDPELIHADHDRILYLTHHAPNFSPRLIHPLSDAELAKHWDQIADIWGTLMKEAIKRGKESTMSRHLVKAWGGLLRVHESLPHQADVAARIASRLSVYLKFEPLASLTAETSSITIIIVRQLWISAKDTLPAETLKRVAASVLTAMLQSGVKPDNRETRSTWIEVCTDLYVVGGADRRKWNSLAAKLALSAPPRAWEGAVSLLVVPFLSWKMTEEETDRWISLFRQAISFADKSAIKSCEVLELLCRHIQNASPTTHLSRKIISALMSKLHLDGASNDIPTTFLTYIDDHLQLYPPDNGDDIYHYLETIRMLAVQLPQCPRGHVVSLLVLLTKGVCAWICDRSEITSDTGYDDNIITFYCGAIDTLCTVTPSAEVLHSLDVFLSAPFQNLKRNVRALHAFNKYWDYVREHIGELREPGALPSGVERSVGIYYHIFGSERPYFFPDTDSLSGSESQSSMSTVPDSQPEEDPEDDANEDSYNWVTPRLEQRGEPGPSSLQDQLHTTPQARPTSALSRPVPPEGQASTSRSPEIPRPKAPTSLSFLRPNRHAPLSVSALQNSEHPSHPADTVSKLPVLGKRHRADPEIFAHKRQKFTESTTGLVSMSNERESQVIRVRGGGSTVDDATRYEPQGPDVQMAEQTDDGDLPTHSGVQRSRHEETFADAENSLPSPPATLPRARAARVDEENAPSVAHSIASRAAQLDESEPSEGEPESPLTEEEFFQQDTGNETNPAPTDPNAMRIPTPLQSVRIARRLIRRNPNMPVDDILVAHAMVCQMYGMLQERIRAHLTDDV